MSLSRKLETLSTCARNLLCNPREGLRKLAALPALVRGGDVARQWGATATAPALQSWTRPRSGRYSQSRCAPNLMPHRGAGDVEMAALL